MQTGYSTGEAEPAALNLGSPEVGLEDISVTVRSYPQLGGGGIPNSFENTTGVVDINHITLTTTFEEAVEYYIYDSNVSLVDELVEDVSAASLNPAAGPIIAINVTGLTFTSDQNDNDGSMDVVVTLQQIVNGEPVNTSITKNIPNPGFSEGASETQASTTPAPSSIVVNAAAATTTINPAAPVVTTTINPAAPVVTTTLGPVVTPGGTTTLGPVVTTENDFAAQSTKEIKELVSNLTPSSITREMFKGYSDIIAGTVPDSKWVPKLTRNPSFWGSDIKGITGISPLAYEPTRPFWKKIFHGVAITRRHILTAAHGQPPIPGTELFFVARDNTIERRTIVGGSDEPNWMSSTSNGGDFQISVLDSDLPDNIDVLKILPEDLASTIPTSELVMTPGGVRYDAELTAIWTPTDALIWGTDQEEKGIIFRIKDIELRSGSIQRQLPADTIALDGSTDEAGMPKSGTSNLVNSAWHEELAHNDSSSPWFFVINNEAVLTGITSGSRGGPLTGGINSTLLLNNLIELADEEVLGSSTGYKVTHVDLTSDTSVATVTPSPTLGTPPPTYPTQPTTTSTTTQEPDKQYILTIYNNSRNEDIWLGGDEIQEGEGRQRLIAGEKKKIKKDVNSFSFSILDIPTGSRQSGNNFEHTSKSSWGPMGIHNVHISGYITPGVSGSFTIATGGSRPTTTTTTTTTTTPSPCGDYEERLHPGGPCVPRCPAGWERDSNGDCYDPDPVDPNSSDGSGPEVDLPGLIYGGPDPLDGTNFEYTDTTTSTTTYTTPPYWTSTTTTSTTTYTTPIYTTPPPPCTQTTKRPPTYVTIPPAPVLTTKPVVTQPPKVTTVPPLQRKVAIYPAPILPLQIPFLMKAVQGVTTTLRPYTTPPPVVATTAPVTTTICPEDPDCNILQY